MLGFVQLHFAHVLLLGLKPRNTKCWPWLLQEPMCAITDLMEPGTLLLGHAGCVSYDVLLCPYIISEA